MSAARILEIGRAQEARGADICKIVTNAGSPEEEAEVLRAVTVLKRELKIPSLLLCGGECRVVRRIGPMLGTCMWLCVPVHDAYATKMQPLISEVKAIKKGFAGDDNV
jgi:3-dehydroquinate dehydratase